MVYCGVETLKLLTPLFSEGLSLKLDEILNTLWGVKEDPHGTPKSQRNNISQRNSYYLFSPGFEPGTSRRGRKSRRREDSKLLVFFSVASEMTNQFVLARTMKEVFLPAHFKSPWSRGRSFA